MTRLKIPTGRVQTSWLFTSAAEKLNPRLPRTTSAKWSEGFQIQRSNHSATLRPQTAQDRESREIYIFLLFIEAKQ